MKDIIKRFKNKGTVIAVVSSVLLIFANLGIEVNNDAVMTIINSICGIGIALGIMNDPTTEGVYNPFKEDK